MTEPEPADDSTGEPTDEPTAEPTDEPTAEPTGEEAAASGGEPTAEPAGEGRHGRDPGRDGRDDEGRDVRELLLRGTLVVLGVLAVVALFQFYTSALAAIDQWIAREYRALFRAAFNLAVLLATGIGISLVARELRAARQ
jgi:hypothetical protein